MQYNTIHYFECIPLRARACNFQNELKCTTENVLWCIAAKCTVQSALCTVQSAKSGPKCLVSLFRLTKISIVQCSSVL